MTRLLRRKDPSKDSGKGRSPRRPQVWFSRAGRRGPATGVRPLRRNPSRCPGPEPSGVEQVEGAWQWSERASSNGAGSSSGDLFMVHRPSYASLLRRVRRVPLQPLIQQGLTIATENPLRSLQNVVSDSAEGDSTSLTAAVETLNFIRFQRATRHHACDSRPNSAG